MKYLETLKGAANLLEALKRYGIYVVLLVLLIFFSATSQHFLVSTNLLNVARQVSMLGIAAVGFAFVLLLGGIDLSIGSNVTLVNIVGAWMMVNAEMNPILAIILVLIMATAIGFKPVLCGNLSASRNIEQMMLQLIELKTEENYNNIIGWGQYVNGPLNFKSIIR